jgi:hypothetical protein
MLRAALVLAAESAAQWLFATPGGARNRAQRAAAFPTCRELS